MIVSENLLSFQNDIGGSFFLEIRSKRKLVKNKWPCEMVVLLEILTVPILGITLSKLLLETCMGNLVYGYVSR